MPELIPIKQPSVHLLGNESGMFVIMYIYLLMFYLIDFNFYKKKCLSSQNGNFVLIQWKILFYASKLVFVPFIVFYTITLKILIYDFLICAEMIDIINL